MKLFVEASRLQQYLQYTYNFMSSSVTDELLDTREHVSVFSVSNSSHDELSSQYLPPPTTRFLHSRLFSNKSYFYV